MLIRGYIGFEVEGKGFVGLSASPLLDWLAQKRAIVS